MGKKFGGTINYSYLCKRKSEMVRCPNGQVLVCKTTQGGSTPPRTSSRRPILVAFFHSVQGGVLCRVHSSQFTVHIKVGHTIKHLGEVPHG